MKYLTDTYAKTGNLHHAYLIEGWSEETLSSLVSFFEKKLNFKCKANPDYHRIMLDTFGIDDGRALKNRAYQKSFGDRKIFVISFDRITREAQSALLKLFEDGAEDTHFFLLTRTSEIFLPTLKSRLFMVSDGGTKVADEKTIKAFLKKSKANRLKDLKDVIESKNKEEAVQFLGGIEEVLYRDGNMASTPEVREALQEIGQVKRYLHDPSPSVKMILEYVALTLPPIK